jgi:K+-transporting ATPase ATPase B chain
MRKRTGSIWDPALIKPALRASFTKLNPQTLWRNPVMLIVEIVSLITTVITIKNLFIHHPFWFDFQISLWLWLTILFANFGEALAEGRGKAQSDSLKAMRSQTYAVKILENGQTEKIPSLSLKKGDKVLVEKDGIIPGDGEIIEGVALVDESAMTGESAPVVRESGGDKSGVTGGTKILSGKITVKITTDPGESFLDQMIAMVESAKRQKTPNEVALEIMLVAMSILFIVVCGTLLPFAKYMKVNVSITVLIALLVCLMPTTIGGLLPAIGIAGMDRLLRCNVIALSGRAVEASGDVNVVLLDKTGTITLGNRMASEFLPAEGVELKELAESAVYASLADDTPEGRSIVALAKTILGKRGGEIQAPESSEFIPFTAETRMSGVNIGERKIRKGASDAIAKAVSTDGSLPEGIQQMVDQVAREGSTPLVVADGNRILGVVRLKDTLKTGISERLSYLRGMGIKSVMITGDNPLTAATIAAEAGIDDFVARCTPEMKLEKIRKWQSDGNLVAMIGDGTNDAPALAQADVAVAMNAGTQAAREAANMVDLDSNPTKLLDIVEVGKQILITRGAITTFSITNDVAKYFAIIPALFAAKYPALNILNIMKLNTPESAILSAVIFNALVIPMLIPLALRGVRYRFTSAAALLEMNLLIYGLGGLLFPFIGIKAIDMLLHIL